MELMPKITFTQPQTLDQWQSSIHQVKLLLIVYDTAAVERLSKSRSEAAGMSQLKLSLPEKYSVCWHKGFDDDGIVAQNLIFDEKSNQQGVWFKHFRDLGTAIHSLQERFSEIEIPPDVSYVIDWPMDRTRLGGIGSKVINNAVFG